MDLWHYRNVLAGLPLGFAFFSTRWEWEDGIFPWCAAGLLVAAGIAVRAWSVCHNRYGRGDKKTLAVTGPYALVRNPLYWGNMAIIAGAVAASELAWFLPVALIWSFLVYDRAVRREEIRLVRKYGDEWFAYRDAVPRWIPNRVPGLERLSSSPLLFAKAATLQAYNGAILLPFVMKELNLFHLWHA